MIAAWFAFFGFAWLTLFQSALALGVPLGAMAWGGQERVLSRSRRLASAAVALIVGVGGCILALQGMGYGAVVPQSVAGVLHICLSALFGLSLIGNLATESRIERAHGVPLCLVLSVSNAWLAWSG